MQHERMEQESTEKPEPVEPKDPVPESADGNGDQQQREKSPVCQGVEAPRKCDKPKKCYWKKPKHWVSLATLFFVAAYTIITTFIWCTSRDTEIQQLRAYVSFDGIELDSLPGTRAPDNSKWRLLVDLQNTGATPTQRATTHVHAALRSSMFPVGSKPEDVPTDFTDSGNIAPHAVINSRAVPDPPLSTDDLIQVRDQSKFLYIWGWVRYRDVFQRTIWHRTKFFSRVEIYGDVEHPFQKDTFFMAKYIFQSTGNCTDDECDEK